MNTQTHAERYNRLADVEMADEQLSAIGRTQVLDALSEVIRDHGLEDWIGIRLLHRHNGLTPDEIMLEKEEVQHTADAALTTIATSLSGIKNRFAPNIWMAADGQYYPMEYSQDPSVVDGPDFIKENDEFFREFESVLASFNASGLLGPCILRRNFFDTHKPTAPAILVETSDEVRRANMLRFVEEREWDTMIQTTWLAVNPETLVRQSVADGGHAALFPMACIPVTGCIRSGTGGHTIVTTGHNPPRT
jgi:hypothetical protein